MKTAIAFALIVLCATAEAAQPSPLANFKFQGIGLGTSVDVFRRAYPTAVINVDKTHQVANVKAYFVAPSEFADAVIFEFVDEKLYSVSMLYSADRIGTLGGIENVATRIAQEFGNPTNRGQTSEAQMMVWSEDTLQAVFIASKDGATILTVFDNAAHEEIKKRKAKRANLGF